MRLAALLRLTALGIAVLGWLDPPVLIAPLPPLPVSIAVARSPLDDAPTGNTTTRTRAEAADAAAAALAAGLAPFATVQVIAFEDPLRLPCGAQEPCVVISDDAMPVRVPQDRRGVTSLVRVGDPLVPNVAVVAVAGRAAHVAAEAHARVTLEGRGVAGHTTRIRAIDAGAVVGEATHTWAGDGRVDVDVPWWPVSAGLRAIGVVASTEAVAERTPADNQAEAWIDVTDGLWPVVFFEPRPSWAAAFVRRALERDPRFEIAARTDVAPGVSRSPASVEDRHLDRARVVVAGGLERLTAADVARLRGFAERRGGAVVLVPDRAPEGPVRGLLGHSWSERLEREAIRAGHLSGTEWLLADGVGPLDEVMLSVEGRPAVVASPAGAGRIVVAGAMDAWRDRGPASGFDRFWQSLAAALAQAAGATVDVSATPRAIRAGERADIVVRGRSLRPRSRWSAAAALRCGESAPQPLRLWPTDAPGTFVGVARPEGASTVCLVTAEIDELGEGRAAVSVTDAPRLDRPPSGARVEDAVRRTGGVDTTADDIGAVIDLLRTLRSDTRTPEPRHPMRSAWWLVPLVGCLAAEWWLRRRAGLR
jgi:hypothetical protein